MFALRAISTNDDRPRPPTARLPGAPLFHEPTWQAGPVLKSRSRACRNARVHTRSPPGDLPHGLPGTAFPLRAWQRKRVEARDDRVTLKKRHLRPPGHQLVAGRSMVCADCFVPAPAVAQRSSNACPVGYAAFETREPLIALR